MLQILQQGKQNNQTRKKKETTIPVTKLDIESYDLEYNKETDAQPFFIWSSVAKTENGYYLWGLENYMNYLMFFDTKTQKTIPMCNLPNCTHTDDTCNAHFSGMGVGTDMIWNDALWYYENYLYIIGCDEEDYVNLYRAKPDGSSREKYMQLYKADTASLEDNGAKEYSVPNPSGIYIILTIKRKKPSLSVSKWVVQRQKFYMKQTAYWKQKGIKLN